MRKYRTGWSYSIPTEVDVDVDLYELLQDMSSEDRKELLSEFQEDIVVSDNDQFIFYAEEIFNSPSRMYILKNKLTKSQKEIFRLMSED